MRLICVLALLLSCRDKPTEETAVDSEDTQVVVDTGSIADADSDGFTADEDCDDFNNAVYPGADEICDGRDNNCDGDVDEDSASDAPTWYTDTDNDNFGNDASFVSACTQPSGTTAVGGDCDDQNPSVHPGAREDDCTDNTDWNCDGSVGYADADGDGFAACEDCNDAEAGVNDDQEETCNDIDDDCDGEIDEDATDATTWYGDSDGDTFGGSQYTATACDAPDGYVATADDCDDLDATSYPSAAETCDGKDNDCDSDVDEGVQATWYADTDGDGYGDATTTTEACSVPTGYTWNGNDCDDTNASTSPTAYEICDSVDNDCDGTVDEDDAVNASTFYADADADGYGDAASPTNSCSAPTAHVADDTDCDDTAAAVNPGASEICDAIDNDCDGETDEDDASDATTWYGDMDGDGYGGTWITATSCTQPTGYTANSDDCDDLESLSFPGALEICDGKDNDCDTTVDEEADLQQGSGNTWYADADSDGYGDTTASTVSCAQPTDYVANSSDCNDSDGGIHPAATEICDTVDNDCNGDIDDADGNLDTSTQLTWYQDADTDTYGDANTSQDSCTQPTGYVANAADCDDNAATANPSGTEVCGDGLDNDCNGDADGNDAIDVSTWYADADTDTYGDAAATTAACTQPTGYVADATDCDDTTSAISPDATETCDGVDNNCSGAIDDAVDLLGSEASCAALSCQDLLSQRSTAGDGSWWVNPDSSGAFQVYCDMTTDGGGWTLVASISSSNQNHFGSNTENNISSSTYPIPFESSQAGRRMSDSVVKALASEDVFRVEVATGQARQGQSGFSYSNFFKYSTPSDFSFNALGGSSSPLIWTSHVYPYSWEEDGGGDGYHFGCGASYVVFDNHNSGCDTGAFWSSSNYSGERVLFGYNPTNGIYNGKAGYMWVR